MDAASSLEMLDTSRFFERYNIFQNVNTTLRTKAAKKVSPSKYLGYDEVTKALIKTGLHHVEKQGANIVDFNVIGSWSEKRSKNQRPSNFDLQVQVKRLKNMELPKDISALGWKVDLYVTDGKRTITTRS